MTRDGQGESVAGMVIMLKGENGKAVAERRQGAHGRDRSARCRAGLAITPFYDQTEVIDRTSYTVRKNLLEGSMLVVVVLFLFLRDVARGAASWRPSSRCPCSSASSACGGSASRPT